MGFFVVAIRVPIGVAASIILLLWSLLVFLVYLVFFVFLAVFGKLTQIHARLNPWLHALNGVKCLPGLWRWVIRPYQAIFEESDDASGKSQESALLQRLKAAAEQQQKQRDTDVQPELPYPTQGTNTNAPRDQRP